MLPLQLFQLPIDALVGHVLEAPGMQKWFDSAAVDGNPDALLLALKMREKISMDSENCSKLLPSPFSPNKLFTVDHLSSLVSCFKVFFLDAMSWNFVSSNNNSSACINT